MSKSRQPHLDFATPITERTCTLCHVTKGASEFRKHKRSPGGLYSRCRDCQDLRSPCVLCKTTTPEAFTKGKRSVCTACTPLGQKWCGGCVALRPIADFSLMTRGVHAGKLSSWCRACGTVASLKSQRDDPERSRKRRTEWARQKRRDPSGKGVATDLVTHAVRRAKESGLPFDDSADFRRDVAARVARGVCEVTGLPFNYSTDQAKKQAAPYRPSLDRIVPDRGYVMGNVRVVLWAVNAAIGSWGLATAQEVARAISAISSHQISATAEPSWNWH